MLCKYHKYCVFGALEVYDIGLVWHCWNSDVSLTRSTVASVENSTARIYILIFVTFSLLLAILLGYFLQQTYQQTVLDVETASFNESQILSARTDTLLRHIESTSIHIADHVVAELRGNQKLAPLPDPISRALTALTKKFPEILHTQVFDADGDLIYSSLENPRRVSVADREHFLEAKSRRDSSIRFTNVLVLKNTGASSVLAYRAIVGTSGEFLGLVTSAIDLAYFAKLFSELAVGDSGMVSIRRSDDSRLIVRWPIVEDEINKTAENTPPYHLIQEGKTEGVIRYIGKSDGVDRIFAFHQVPEFPFYVLVGRGVDEQFAAWRKSALLLVSLTITALALLWWTLSRLIKSDKRERDTRQFLSNTQAIAKVGGWKANPDDDSVYWTPEIFRLVEHPESHPPAGLREGLAYYAPEYLTAITENLGLAWARGTPFCMEAQVITRTGKRLWTELRCIGRVADGEESYLTGTLQDISARKQIETELEEHRQNLEKLVEARTLALSEREQRLRETQRIAQLGSWEFHLATRSLTWSEETFRIAGLPLRDTAPSIEEYRSTVHPEDLPSLDKCFENVLNNHLPYELELRHRRPDGSYNITLTRGQPVIEGGQLVKIVGSVLDIAERKAIEQTLIQAKAAAEAANIAKSAFLANMSHEIRTPMNGVLGMLEILSHSPLAVDERKMVDMIWQSARSLLGIIDDILDVSKIEAGKLNLEEKKVSLEGEVDIMVGMLDRVAMGRQVDLSVFFDPKLPQLVIGDGLRVRQILTNLIGNAIKFSASQERIGRVQFRAELTRCDNEKVWVSFSVADNGIGMDEETVTRLFRPFEQADNSTTRKFGGTGLGLSIVKSLTSMMGGNINLESNPGRGSLFTVQLPFVLASECPNTESSFDLAGLDCVVVTDETRYLNDYTHYLSHAGATTHAFPDLEAAWNFIKAYLRDTPVCMVVMADPGKISSQEIVDRLIASEPGDNVHFVNIAYLSVERGKRRKVRRLSERVVQIDREAMTRSRFLEATAAATGRIVLMPEERGQDAALEATLGKGLNILVAEDNEVNREVIQRQLTILGHHADLAVDGQLAFQRWTAGSYDLVLTDLHMPNLDGYGLTALIRENERNRNLVRTPIIALTANAMKGQEAICREKGMDGYLSKPTELEHLKVVLNHWATAGSTSQTRDIEDGLKPPMSESDAIEVPIFDQTTLVKITGNKPEFHRQLLEKYLANIEGRATELIQAIDSKDGITVNQIAHSLKSASRSIGAMCLGEVCERLELACKVDQAADCSGIRGILEDALRLTIIQIKGYLKIQ